MSESAEFSYTPDGDVKIHPESAIRLLCAAFQSHEDGLPEWIKNSADEYARLDAPPEDRIIVVMMSTRRRDNPGSISVLDFGGMTAERIENSFRSWANPDAAKQGLETVAVQGGHGNGGKCYMTMMFDAHAYVHTVKLGLGSRYGVAGQSVKFGYIPDSTSGRSYQADNLEQELVDALESIGVSPSALPSTWPRVLDESQGFTLVGGRSPKGTFTTSVAKRIVESIRDHPQMVQSISFCSIYVLVNGRKIADSFPIRLEPVEPDPAFPEPRVIEIPETLEDPDTRVSISTTEDGKHEPGRLILRTSDVSMRWSRKLRHRILFKAQSGFIGSVAMIELGVQSSGVNKIYGECELDSLETAKLNNRANLANSPLSRAVLDFIGHQVLALAQEFEERDRRSYDQVERDELSEINSALDRWKNQFMAEHILGITGDESGSGGSPDNSLKAGVPASVHVDSSFQHVGIGVPFKPRLRFYDRNDTQIRSVPYKWNSSDESVVAVDSDLNLLMSVAPGHAEIWVETLDGKCRSGGLIMDVVEIVSIELSPSRLELPSGSRQRISSVSTISDGTVLRDVGLIWTEGDSVVARVSSGGFVFGGSIGTTEIFAGDDNCDTSNTVDVEVVEGSKGGGSGSRGPQYPQILISSVDADPETGEDVNLSADDPPVWQRPQDVDRNVWWINSSAPLAKLYLDNEKGFGYRTSGWRIYHVERFIEVIAQIAIASEMDGQSLDIGSWLLAWGEKVTTIQSAAAVSLNEFIGTGTLPEAS